MKEFNALEVYMIWSDCLQVFQGYKYAGKQ